MKDQHSKGYQQSLEIPKAITLISKTLETVAPGCAVKFASRLFMSPLKHQTPKRELHMDTNSVQTSEIVPGIQKEIIVYEYGKASKKVLLVHGWSGRGTQLVKIADALLEAGYSTVSYDAPAHGKAGGKRTNMREFIEAAMLLEQKYGPFEFAVGHSLGGMTLLNAVKRGMKLRKLVVVGSGDVVEDIAIDFTRKIGLSDAIGVRMKRGFDRFYGEDINTLSASKAATDVHIPVLVIHDRNDPDVPVSSAENIHEHLSNATLVLTEGLGHRKILGDSVVIQRIMDFLTEN